MKEGEVLGGRYTLQDRLGRGGMAIVWRAHDTVLDRFVAVKLLAGRHASEPGSRRRIRDEARAAGALSHPHIAQVYDYGEDDTGTPYVVMELVRGSTLEQRLRSGPLAPAYAMRIGAEVAAALAAAHDHGLVHRDIKPANVMVTDTGAKVVDFGIAAAADQPDLDDGSELFGTPAYLAPERLIGGVVEPASDVYALGVLLYRMLSGGSPWTADTTTQMLSAHIYVEPEPLPPLADVPGFITELCNRCLSKDPALRPSARDAAEQLAKGAGGRIATDELVRAPTAPAIDDEPSALLPAERTGPVLAAAVPALPSALQRGRTLRVGAGAVLATGVVVALWVLAPGGRDDRQSAAESLPSARPSATTTPSEPITPVAQQSSATDSRPAPTVAAADRPRNPAVLPAGTQPPATPPAQATPTSARPTPGAPTTPPATPREFTSIAGTVRASCPSASTAEILSWAPVQPYRVGQVNAGPAAAPAVEFRRGMEQVLMTVTCSDGIPSVTNS